MYEKIVTFHGLRHTQGTEQLNAGVPSAIVSKRLGHSTIEITHRIYYHALLDHQEKAVEVAEHLINPHAQPNIRVIDGKSEDFEDAEHLTSAQ